MITVLIFDIGGVCLSDSWNSTIRQAFARRFNIPLEHVERVSKDLHDARCNGQIEERAFLQQLSEGYPVEIGRLQQFIREGIEPLVGTLELIKMLKATGYYRLLSINNEGKGWSTFRITQYHLDDLFDVIYTSCDVGVCKPDPGIFELVIEREGLEPSATVFIDNKAINLAPAAQLGMRTILFRSPEQLREKLKALGVRLEEE